MNKTLHFSISIHAPKEHVFKTMLEKETYKLWATVFSPGSHYEGSWVKGGKIHFLSPEGEGVTSVIEEVNPNNFVSIKHVGWIKDGKEDTESPQVKAWVPAYENYTYKDEQEGTAVMVDLGVTQDFEADMQALWPKALQKLKEICETPSS